VFCKIVRESWLPKVSSYCQCNSRQGKWELKCCSCVTDGGERPVANKKIVKFSRKLNASGIGSRNNEHLASVEQRECEEETSSTIAAYRNMEF
jgi:hypothetical protein